MADPFEKGLLYGQLDDMQPLDRAQLRQLMKQAATFPNEFKNFDLPRLPIGCRPRDAEALKLLCEIVAYPVVSEHPGFGEFIYELAAGIDMCRTEEQIRMLRSWPSSAFAAVLDDFDGAAWTDALGPAPVAALIGEVGEVPVGVLSDAVRRRIEGLGPEFLDRYFESFHIGPRATIQTLSEDDLCDMQERVPWDVFDLADVASTDICSARLVRVSREAALSDEGQVGGQASTFVGSVIALLAVPGVEPPLTVEEFLRDPGLWTST
jgi:hypothetical protein